MNSFQGDHDLQQLRKLFCESEESISERLSPYFYVYFKELFKDGVRFEDYVSYSSDVFVVTNGFRKKVLDVGCGFGIISILFGMFGSDMVVGYDSDSEKIRCFEEILCSVVPSLKNVRVKLGDALEIDYLNETFDVVIANDVISHVRDLGLFFDEVRRVLKKDGVFYIYDANNKLFLPLLFWRRKFWNRCEYGPVDSLKLRKTDIHLPYLETRKMMIKEYCPSITSKDLQTIAKETAGMYGREILQAAEEFLSKGTISNKPKFKFRNPLTGEFPEFEINPFRLKRMLNNNGFICKIIGPFLSSDYSGLKGGIKRILSRILKIYPILSFFLSPTFRLRCHKG
jgi:SAM-dependent methyltransferase